MILISPGNYVLEDLGRAVQMQVTGLIEQTPSRAHRAERGASAHLDEGRRDRRLTEDHPDEN